MFCKFRAYFASAPPLVTRLTLIKIPGKRTLAGGCFGPKTVGQTPTSELPPAW